MAQEEKKNDVFKGIIERDTVSIEQCDEHDVFNGYIYNAQLLDLRSYDDFEKSHIHTATHVDMDEMEPCVVKLSQKFQHEHFDHKKKIICIDYGTYNKNKKSMAIYEKLYNLCQKHIQCKWFKVTSDSFNFEEFQRNYPFVCVSSKEDEGWGTVRKRYPSVIIPNKFYLGDMRNRQHTKLLKHLGITHIVDISRGKFDDEELFEILAIDLNDVPHAPINEYFDEAVEFIDNAFGADEKNRVFVHCQAGISRSTTIILAYLMKKRGYSLYEGYKLCQRNRPKIHPNDGFLKHLVEFEMKVYVKSTKQQMDDEKFREQRDLDCLIM